VLIGSSHFLETLRTKEFLTRNYQPHSYIDLERDAEVQEVLDRFSLSIEDLQVLICRGAAVLRNPTNEEITACLGSMKFQKPFGCACNPQPFYCVILITL
jgi:thioredoxin reductase (NADPH)